MSQQPSVHQLYKRLETVGKGAYGSVHKGKHIPSGNIVALKIINLDTSDDDVSDIQREVALLTQLRDAPNITKYYGCYMDGPRVWIVMEFAQGGSVLSLMKASNDSCIEERFVAVIIREVLVALSYLHKVPVIHRDMKAANVLVTATGKVMICDFGVSALLATTSSKRNTLTGTPYWMAPEVVQSVPAYDTKADIWSLGIMIYEMIKGMPPHSNLDKFKVMDIIPRTKPPRLTEAEGGKDMRDFMSCCLKEVPSERLPADELAKTKWMKSVAKVPLSILTELVQRLQQAGPRASLAGPLDWEEEEERELQNPYDEDENTWEFDTVRGRGLNFSHLGDSLHPDDGTTPAQATIRPPAPAALPVSLRNLFGDNDTTASDPFRTPHLAPPSTPSLSIQIPPTPPPLFPAETPTVLRPKTPDADGGRTMMRLPDRARSRSVAPSPQVDRGQPFPSISAPSGPDASGDAHEDLSTHPEPSPTIPAIAREPRSFGSQPELRAPEATDTKKSNEVRAPPPLRKRSQSAGGGLNAQRNGLGPRPTHDLGLPSTFQFPPNQARSPLVISTAPSSTHSSRDHGRHPSNLISPTSPSSTHQTTYSLDASTPSRRLAAPGSLSPNVITRTRSATAIPEPSPHHGSADHGDSRKPSTTITHIDPLASPLKFTQDRADQFSRGITPTTHLGTPGLKDVLKIPSLSSEHHLGMSDLLPPSPSAFVHNTRYFAPTPSQLSNSTTSSSTPNNNSTTSFEQIPSQSTLPPPPSSSASTTSSSTPKPMPIPTPPIPPPFSSTSSSYDSTPTIPYLPSHERRRSSEMSSSSFFAAVHGNRTGGYHQQGQSSSHTPRLPAPLDYTSMIMGGGGGTESGHHAGLSRAVHDLAMWLSTVEAGLNALLDGGSTNGNGSGPGLGLGFGGSNETIQEEQEQEQEQDREYGSEFEGNEVDGVSDGPPSSSSLPTVGIGIVGS
ncbi:hypothetical protein AX16_006930 [Volvariella volvacea WC 439]|nr:hypothetical protein AX16_006930 [Volvariella volvacea WC 439]